MKNNNKAWVNLQNFTLDKYKPEYRLQNFALCISLVTAISILLGSPIFTWLFENNYIAKWFWIYHTKNLNGFTGYVCVALALMSILLSLHKGFHVKSSVLPLFLGAVLLQHGFALLENRGLQGLKDRADKTGHSEFLLRAVEQSSFVDTLKSYEERVNSGELGRYPPSKPPGTLMFYMLSSRIADALAGDEFSDKPSRIKNLSQLMVFIWPLIAALVVFPSFAVAKKLLPVDISAYGVFFFLLTPSFCLIPLHTDQVLFPSLFMLNLWACLEITSKEGLPLWQPFGLGILFYLSAFIQFPMLTAIVPLIALLLFSAPQRGLMALRAIVILGLTWAGFLLSDFAFKRLFDYDFLLRYRSALSYHGLWTGWREEVRLQGIGSNLLEASIWIGPPIFWSFLAVSVTDIGRLRLFNSSSRSAVAFGIVLILIVLLLFGKSLSEVARLWLFLMPSICIYASATLNKINPAARMKRVTAITVAQVFLSFAIKQNMDFY